MSSERAPSSHSVAELASRLASATATPHRTAIEFDGWTAEVLSNSPSLTATLGHYSRLFATDTSACDETIHAYECDAVDWGLEYRDWARAPGKVGKKEQVSDLADGWVVRKVRTGMQFALGAGHRVAAGPCTANFNQIVNFVNAAFMSHRLNRGWVLCHAAAVARESGSVAIAGVSGAGKSTLALHAMNSGLSFVSNDRLLIKRTVPNGALEMTGVPKHPRINPGTALANPSLRSLVAPARQAQLQAMPRDELWSLEDKYDADVGDRFGGRWTPRSRTRGLIILNWSPRDSSPAKAREVDLATRPDLWPTVVKHPGPLHVDRLGERAANTVDVASEPYLEALSGIPVVEVTGGVDFDLATARCLELLGAA